MKPKSRLELDRALLGETPEDPELTARLAALRDEDLAFLAAYPTQEALARATRQPRRAPLFAAVGLAVAAAAGFVVGPSLRPQEVRAKGDDAVTLFVQRGGVAEPFTGQAVRARDTLVFRYSTHRGFMLVMGLSAAHAEPWIAREGRSVGVEPGQARAAPFGVQLDEAPEPERVVVLLSQAPLDATEVARALEAGLKAAPPDARAALDPGPLELEAHVTSWLLTKELE